jgi:hypothetical protein
MEGTSFFIVDVVFVRCGFSGFDFWISPCASEFAWRLSVGLSAERGKEVERKRDVDFDIGSRKECNKKRDGCILEAVEWNNQAMEVDRKRWNSKSLFETEVGLTIN